MPKALKPLCLIQFCSWTIPAEVFIEIVWVYPNIMSGLDSHSNLGVGWRHFLYHLIGPQDGLTTCLETARNVAPPKSDRRLHTKGNFVSIWTFPWRELTRRVSLPWYTSLRVPLDLSSFPSRTNTPESMACDEIFLPSGSILFGISYVEVKSSIFVP